MLAAQLWEATVAETCNVPEQSFNDLARLLNNAALEYKRARMYVQAEARYVDSLRVMIVQQVDGEVPEAGRVMGW